jgi:hypothetical protein
VPVPTSIPIPDPRTEASDPAACYTKPTPDPGAAKPDGDWAVRIYNQEEVGVIFVNGELFHIEAGEEKDSGWLNINDLLMTGNNEIILASWNNTSTLGSWGFGIQHNGTQVWENERRIEKRDGMSFVQRLWITPDGDVKPASSLEAASTPPKGQWGIIIGEIDDVAVVTINGMPVILGARNVYGSGWAAMDVTTKLATNCNNSIKMLAWNFEDAWAYKFDITHNGTTIWSAEKSGSGSTGLFFDQEVTIKGDGEVVQ